MNDLVQQYYLLRMDLALANFEKWYSFEMFDKLTCLIHMSERLEFAIDFAFLVMDESQEDEID